jgi:hypothetical protein
MQRLEVSGAVRPIYESLGVKRLRMHGHTNIKFLRSTLATGHSSILAHVTSLDAVKHRLSLITPVL